MKPKWACRMAQYQLNETKVKSVAPLWAEIWCGTYLSVLYEEWRSTVYHISPTLSVFDTRKHAKWECTRSSIGCMQKYTVSQTIRQLCLVWGLQRIWKFGLLFRRRSRPLLPRSLRKPLRRNGKNECRNAKSIVENIEKVPVNGNVTDIG